MTRQPVDETDARTKWCPFARAPEGANRHFMAEDGTQRIHPACRCIASGCMAWRWVDETNGYCGLVGDPRTLVRFLSTPGPVIPVAEE